ncbi:ferritin-like domain-containing protein [Flavobacterium sp. Sd200]|uniref:ferritin-like domain-containing protein n=1 Tax=Flavobacterium sp. Sd200 TaxID=2692211 RepID=UPI00136A85F4|nr:ferritin-like domain-containing protein [Flavobacterium sp. Sd200]MXN91443.1 ferritin-like domain-containing protein [Flavobacterium sp. Sd200]
MNILKFIESFTNEGIIQNLSTKGSRRDSFAMLGKAGANVAMAALPMSLLFSQKATAKNNSSSAFLAAAADTPTGALQLALTLEYLEDEFYDIALNTLGLIPAADRDVIAKISQHEQAHVTLLRNALGADAPEKPTFDFTVNNTFPTFTDYQTFLAVAQAFEDTGVRAYKGQAGNLISTPNFLTTALQIHSVEARHASQIRRMRGLKGWIVGNDRGTGMPEQTQAVYDGEQNTNQAGFMTNAVPGTFTPALTSTGGTESFDEPITGAVAQSIAGLFIRS